MIHVGERIEFETREGVMAGRVSRALGGDTFVVQLQGSDRKFQVQHLPDGRFVIPALLETAK